MEGRSFRAAMPLTPEEAQARHLGEELLEILKYLNRAEEEKSDVDGYELPEIVYFLQKRPFPGISEAEVERDLELLVTNRLAAVLTDDEYAWERNRTVGRRWVITLEGKEYLLKQLSKVQRIE